VGVIIVAVALPGDAGAGFGIDEQPGALERLFLPTYPFRQAT